MALGVISALQQQQLAVPEHVSVIGYDNTEDSAYFLPALTTVSQDFNRLGQEAVNRLLARLGQGGGAEGQSIMLPTHLVTRHSTAVPPDGKPSFSLLADELQRIAALLRR